MKNIVTVFAILWLVVPAAYSQVGIELGPKLGFDVAGDVEEPFIGLDARFSTTLPVIINPTFDYYFTEENFTLWQIALHALYEFGVANEMFTPYAGGGISLTRSSFDLPDDPFFDDIDASDSSVGLNGIAGAKFPVGGVDLFGQVQLTVGDVDMVALAVGALFSLGN